jgi:hypothetical protein
LESELTPFIRIWWGESELAAAKGQVESVKKRIDEAAKSLTLGLGSLIKHLLPDVRRGLQLTNITQQNVFAIGAINASACCYQIDQPLLSMSIMRSAMDVILSLCQWISIKQQKSAGRVNQKLTGPNAHI